jgi:Kdo2-lipid IVA lauroyltransferase/acyltransferase
MLTRWLILPLLRALSFLAVDTASRLGGMLGVAAFHLGVRRKVASNCVQMTLGLRGIHRRDVVRRSYASMGATFTELWTVGGVDGGERHLTTGNPTWTQQVLTRHPGCIFLSPHLGNWDIGAHGVARLMPKLYAYAKAQHNAAVDEATNVQRAKLGITVLLTRRGDRTTAVQVLRGLRSGCPIALLADQAPTGDEGTRAIFMGVATDCHAGPAFFARKANAPIVPAICVRRRAGEFVLVIGRPVPAQAGDDRALTQASMDLLAAMIAAVPGQYFWQHKRFKKRSHAEPRPREPWKIHGLSLLEKPLEAMPSRLSPPAF